MKSNIALAICGASVVLALVQRSHGASMYNWIGTVACVWFFTGLWLGNGWKHLNQFFSQMYRGYREGKTPDMPRLAFFMTRAGGVLMMVSIATLFFK